MFAPATKPSPLHVFDSFGDWYHRITTALAGASAARRTYAQLSGLSASQLAARGMTREDISGAVLRAFDEAQR